VLETAIWQPSRLSGRRSAATPSSISDIVRVDIDMAGRAGAGAAAFTGNSGNIVVDRRYHDRKSIMRVDRSPLSGRKDKNDP